IILTHEELRGMLPTTPADVIVLESKLKQVAAYVDENLRASELSLLPRNLLYVIYTSGSTGRPKGTAMSHGSMVNLIDWHRRTFSALAGERVLQFAALSFDVAFQEIFSTLCTGGTLMLVREGIRRDPAALFEFIRHQGVQRLFVPPVMLQQLAEC